MFILLFVVVLFIVWAVRCQLDRYTANGMAASSICDIARPKLIGMPHEDRVQVLKEILRPENKQSDLHFHPGHTWARTDEEGLVQIGPDEITVRLLGDIETVCCSKMAGEEIYQGEVCWRFKKGRRSIKQVSPVSGIVAEVNERAFNLPAEVGESPYGRGWLYKINPSNLAGDLSNLFTGSLAEEWLSLSKRRINAIFTPPAAFATAQDGGELINDIGALMTDEQWERISTELFNR